MKTENRCKKQCGSDYWIRMGSPDPMEGKNGPKKSPSLGFLEIEIF